MTPEEVIRYYDAGRCTSHDAVLYLFLGLTKANAQTVLELTKAFPEVHEHLLATAQEWTDLTEWWSSSGHRYEFTAENIAALKSLIAPKEETMTTEETLPTTMWGYAEHEDAECFVGQHKTREEAIAAGRENYQGAFWVASGTRQPASSYMPDVDYILEAMGERGADVAGDMAEDFPAITDDAKEELSTLLAAWADKHVTVDFWEGDGNSEKIEAL